MEQLKRYIAAEGATAAPDMKVLDDLLTRHEWFTVGRAVRRHISAAADPVQAAISVGRRMSSLERQEVDVQLLTALTADDIIDRFLQQEDLRIVADEEGDEPEVTTEPELAADDDVVSEQLAEIYAAQGLHDKAIEIYRKLSLRNPEKSVYFAELIGNIEKIKE